MKYKSKTFSGLSYFMFIAPALIIYAAFLLYPTADALKLSFYSWDGGISKTFIGFKNFLDMLDDGMLFLSLRNTMYFLLSAELVIVPLSFIFAVIVNEKIKGYKAFRSIIYLPNIISSIAISIIWYFILNSGYSGILNAFLDAASLGGMKKDWLMDEGLVAIVCTIPFIWAYCASNMLIFLGAIKSIPTELFEAAAIDGITGIRKLTSITIPLSWEAIKAIALLTVCSSMQEVGIVMGLTGGGPAGISNNVGTYIYQKAYQESFFGYATAVSVLLLLISMLVVALFNKFLKSNDN